MTDAAIQSSLNLIEKDYPKLKDINPISLWKIVKLRRSIYQFQEYCYKPQINMPRHTYILNMTIMT